MEISLTEFAKTLESESKKFSALKIAYAAKDLTDLLFFISVYKLNGNIAVSSKQNYNCYSFETADGSKIKLKLGNGMALERINTNNNYKFFTETIINDKTFTRNAELKCQQLGKINVFKEQVQGSTNKGAYHLILSEESSLYKIEAFLIPTKTQNNLYYSYSTAKNEIIMGKADNKFSTIPCLDWLGIKEISLVLENQFEEKSGFIAIDEESVFNNIKFAALSFYKNK